jgi:hypothetical protein
MWPFSRKKVEAITVVHGGITATYDPSFRRWTFSSGGLDYAIYGRRLDTETFARIGPVPGMLTALQPEIDARIAGHPAMAGVAWNGEKHADPIDVTALPTVGRIEVTYANDDAWGYLWFTVVIAEGKISDCYATAD